MKLVIHGAALNGLVLAAKLAEAGNHVACVALDEEERVSLLDVHQHLTEPQLPALLLRVQERQYLQFVTYDASLCHASVHFLAAHSLSFERAGELLMSLLGQIPEELFFVVATPLPIGSLDRLQQMARDARTGAGNPAPVHVLALPLFVREGSAIADFMHPPLVVVGSADQGAENLLMDLLRPFHRQAGHVMTVPLATAELIKFAINAMLATRVSFMNELASLSERLAVDIELVRQGMAADPRIGPEYLLPGCGFGGPSFSSELLSFARTVQEQLDTGGLIEQVLAINESQREILFRKIWRYFRGELSGRTIAIWGAAFKAGTSSTENSVVHPLLQALWAQGCHVRVHDPAAGETLQAQYPDQTLLTICPDLYAACVDADAIAVVTAWDEFWNPDFAAVAATMKSAVLFDGRNIYDPARMQDYGFDYFGIGRGKVV